MEIDPVGLPIHRDATFDIRPRISWRATSSSTSIRARPRRRWPRRATRSRWLRHRAGADRPAAQRPAAGHPIEPPTLLQQYGYAVERAVRRTTTRSTTGCRLQVPSIVSTAALGEQPHDLSNSIDKSGQVAGAIDEHPPNLKSLITDFNTTASDFARVNVSLEQAVRDLPTRSPPRSRRQRLNGRPAAAGARRGH